MLRPCRRLASAPAIRFRGNNLINDSHLAGDVHDLHNLPVGGTFVSLYDDQSRIVQQIPLFLKLVFQVGEGHRLVV